MLVGSAAGVLLYRISSGLSLFIPFVVYHFFLFCNIFRIPRKPELIWAGFFIINSAIWAFSGSLKLAILFGVQFFITLIILFHAVRQPAYHGIFSQRLNPRLKDYLSGKV